MLDPAASGISMKSSLEKTPSPRLLVSEMYSRSVLSHEDDDLDQYISDSTYSPGKDDIVETLTYAHIHASFLCCFQRSLQEQLEKLP